MSECCPPLVDVTSAKKTHTYTVPVARVYEEVGRVNAKKQLFEPTAYEVPVNVKETDMVRIWIIVCISLSLSLSLSVCVCVVMMYTLLCTC